MIVKDIHPMNLNSVKTILNDHRSRFFYGNPLTLYAFCTTNKGRMHICYDSKDRPVFLREKRNGVIDFVLPLGDVDLTEAIKEVGSSDGKVYFMPNRLKGSITEWEAIKPLDSGLEKLEGPEYKNIRNAVATFHRRYQKFKWGALTTKDGEYVLSEWAKEGEKRHFQLHTGQDRVILGLDLDRHCAIGELIKIDGVPAGYFVISPYPNPDIWCLALAKSLTRYIGLTEHIWHRALLYAQFHHSAREVTLGTSSGKSMRFKEKFGVNKIPTSKIAAKEICELKPKQMMLEV